MIIEADDLMVIQWIQYYKGGVASQNGSWTNKNCSLNNQNLVEGFVLADIYFSIC